VAPRVPATPDEALSPLLSEYDYVLIDTQPTLGHLLHLALVIADDVIAPAVPEYDAVRGAQRFRDFVTLPKNRRSLGIRADIVGIIVNAKRAGVATHEGRVEKALEQWGDVLWRPPLPLPAPFHDTQEWAEPPHNATGKAGQVIRYAAKALVDRYLERKAA
jgi:cellulose biosynthesis protein BcsQ